MTHEVLGHSTLLSGCPKTIIIPKMHYLSGRKSCCEESKKFIECKCRSSIFQDARKHFGQNASCTNWPTAGASGAKKAAEMSAGSFRWNKELCNGNFLGVIKGERSG